MIKASELRIGNIVKYDLRYFDEGTQEMPLQVISIDKEHGFILDDGFNNVYNSTDLNPIPLTPKILEKCGFEHDNGYYQDPKGKLFLHPQDIRYTEFIAYAGEWNFIDEQYCIGEIKSLHQLQNLYYALTQMELEITL